MIRDVIENNENVTTNSYELEKLQKSFPQYFDKDGKFNFDKFKNVLDTENIEYSDEAFSTKESYSLNFVGKKFAQIQCGQDATTVITPDLEHNNKEENKNSENIYIKGDNLEALKHLLHSYENKIKCIYIDPPYNTGSDEFAYPDNFKYDKETLIKMGLSEDEAERVENLYGKSTHSAWLTFMLPRLTLAQDLLSDDGVIFISIDDNEVKNLKNICDEVFGEINNIGLISTINNLKGRSDSEFFATCNEFLLVYAKNKQNAKISGFDIEDEEIEKDYKYEDEISKWKPIGFRKTGNGWKREDRPYMYYPVLFKDNIFRTVEKEEYCQIYNPKTNTFNDNFVKELQTKYENLGYKFILPKDEKGSFGRWRWGLDTFYKEKDINLTLNNSNTLCTKMRATIEDGSVRMKSAKTLWYKPEYDTGSGTKILKELFNGKDLFNNPKSFTYILDILKISVNKNDIVLDFFSGSATTANAVMQLNAGDGGNRKFIMVQIQEKTKESSEAYKAGYRTICDIGIDRIKRASKKIKEETNTDIDYGFKIYTLNDVKKDTLDTCLSFDKAKNLSFAEDYRNNFSYDNVAGEETILQTYKVKDGYGFTEQHKEIELGESIAYLIKKTIYLINPTLSDFIKPLIEQLDNELKDINRIVVFGYSFTLTQLQSLQTNIKNFNDVKNQDDKVKIEVRY